MISATVPELKDVFWRGVRPGYAYSGWDRTVILSNGTNEALLAGRRTKPRHAHQASAADAHSAVITIELS